MSIKDGPSPEHASPDATARCVGRFVPRPVFSTAVFPRRIARLMRPMSAALRDSSPATLHPGLEQEFAFSAQDFERVRRLIYDHAGISLHAGKQAMVYSRLSRRLRETGHRTFAAYLAWLEQAHD